MKKWEHNKKGIQLAKYNSGPIGGKRSLVNLYNEMVGNASNNIGRYTNNGVLITEKLIKKFEQRRNELIKGKL